MNCIRLFVSARTPRPTLVHLRIGALVLVTALVGAGCSKSSPTGPDGTPRTLNGVIPLNETVQASWPLSILLDSMMPDRGTTAPVGSKVRLWGSIKNNHHELKLVFQIVVVDGPSDPGSGRATPIFQGWTELMPGEDRAKGSTSVVEEDIPWLRFQGCLVELGWQEGGCPRLAEILVFANLETRWRFRR